MRRLTRDVPRRTHDQQRRQQRQNRVSALPAQRDNEDSRHDGRYRPQQVTQYVQPSTAQIKVMLITAVQQLGRNHIDDEPRNGNSQHGNARNRSRVTQSPYRLNHDPQRQHEQDDAIHEGGQHLPALIAIATQIIWCLARQRDRNQRKSQRQHIAQHMNTVSNQHQRTAQYPRDQLRHHENDGKQQRPFHPSRAILSFRHRMVVMRVIVMIMSRHNPVLVHCSSWKSLPYQRQRKIAEGRFMSPHDAHSGPTQCYSHSQHDAFFSEMMCAHPHGY